MAEGGRTGGSSMSPAKWVPYVRPGGEGRGKERVLGRTGREDGGWGCSVKGAEQWRGGKEETGEAREVCIFQFSRSFCFCFCFLKLLRLVGTFFPFFLSPFLS